MKVLLTFVVVFGFVHLRLTAYVISDDSVAKQLAFLTEKYLQLDSKYEIMQQNLKDLSRENTFLRNRMEKIENRSIQIQLNDRDDNEKELFTKPNNNTVLPADSQSIYKDPVQFHNLNRDTSNDENEKFDHSDDTDSAHQVGLPNSRDKADTQYHNKRLLIGAVTTPSTDVPKVAFTAILSLASAFSVGQHQAIEYNKVLTNVGNAYDPRHGHFIAPTKGVYLMSFTLMNIKGKTMDIEMVKNGNRIAYGYGDPSGFAMGTQVTIVLLEQGDMVWVRHGGSSEEQLNGGEYNTFAGTLLFQM